MTRIAHVAVALAALLVGPPPAPAAEIPAPRVSLLFAKSPMRAVADAVRAALLERRPELLACYQQTLAKDADPEASVTLSFHLQASGAVSMPKAEFYEAREDEAGDRFLQCLTARAGKWKLPAPEGGAAPVSAGFAFSTRAGAAEGEAPAEASLAMDEILGVVRAHAPEIRACYLQELAQDPLLEGRVMLRWTVRPDGSVTGAELQDTTLRNRKVLDCMLAQVTSWRFPRPKNGKPVTISNPWVLKRSP